jgi:multiple sugar transport system permease protein
MRSTTLARLLRPAFLVLLLAFSLVPFWWMLVASLKAGDDQLTFGNPWWFDEVYWGGYWDLFAGTLFRTWMLNTVLVLVATLAISLVASCLAAYALAYLGIPHARHLVLVFFATYLVPQGVLFLPLVKLLAHVHLLNSPAALIATYPSLVIPFGTWVLWSFFNSLPRDMVDLARLEGAGPVRILVTLLLPLSAPALAAVGLFAVAVVFNDFLYAFTFIQSQQDTTLMGGVGLLSTDLGETGSTFAAVIVGVAPIAVGCALFADHFARGLATGIIE